MGRSQESGRVRKVQVDDRDVPHEGVDQLARNRDRRSFTKHRIDDELVQQLANVTPDAMVVIDEEDRDSHASIMATADRQCAVSFVRCSRQGLSYARRRSIAKRISSLVPSRPSFVSSRVR